MAADAFMIGQLVAQLGLDSTQFNAGMASANAKMKAADAAMAKATTSMAASYSAMGARMQKIGKQMSKFITLPILAIGAASFKAHKDFEASMSKIEGLVGVAAEEVERLSQEVLKLSPSLGRGPTELADALFFVESAGIRGAAAMDVLEKSAKASVAGLGETKTIADLVTSAMNAYGHETLNATMATDVLVAAVREGKAEATDMAGAIGVVLPIASEMGVMFDDVGAAFAGMTRTGTPARVAATQLKAVMSSLLKPTDQAEEALNSMQLSSAGLRKQIKEEGLITTLETLRKTTNKYGEEAMAKVFPNIRALMGVLDLMGANMESNIAISERMKDTTGSLDKAYQAAATTVQNKMDKAVAQVQTSFVKFGTYMKATVVPLLEGFAKVVKNMTDRLDGMTDEGKKLTFTIVALAAAMGPLLSIGGRLMKVIAANPYAALAVAIAAIVMASIKWVKTNRELFDGMSGIEKAHKDGIKLYGKQRGEIDLLVRKIESENLSNGARIDAINELKKIVPEYNGMITEEGKLVDSNTDSIKAYLVQLGEKIKLQAYEEEYTRLLKREFELQGKIIDVTIKAAAGNKLAELRLAKLNFSYDKNREAIAEMEAAASKLNITLGKTPDAIVPAAVTPAAGGSGGSGDDDGPLIATIAETVQDAEEYWNTYYDLVEENQKTFEAAMIDSNKKVTEAFVSETENRIAADEAEFQAKVSRANMYLQIAERGVGQLAAAVSGQEGAWKALIGTILAGLQRVLMGLLAQAIAGMIAGEASKGLFGLATGAIGVTALTAIWNAKVPEFADGGLVYGETIGKLGEYPGASSNPEVIAPLSELQKYMNPFGRSGGPPAKIKLVLEGRDAVAMVDLERLIQGTY